MKHTFISEGVRYSKYTDRGRQVRASVALATIEMRRAMMATWSILAAAFVPAALTQVTA